jgi:hypothetical protein
MSSSVRLLPHIEVCFGSIVRHIHRPVALHGWVVNRDGGDRQEAVTPPAPRFGNALDAMGVLVVSVNPAQDLSLGNAVGLLEGDGDSMIRWCWAGPWLPSHTIDYTTTRKHYPLK